MDISLRCKRILYELLNNPTFTGKELSQKLNITQRQLGYGIEKINEWLLNHNLPPIERTRKGYFSIDPIVFAKLSPQTSQLIAKKWVLTVKQRIDLILLMLLTSKEELSLNHFSFELNVSKNTILNDFQHAQKLLAPYGLTLRYTRKTGYSLDGEEFQKRKLLIHLIHNLLLTAEGEHHLKETTKIQDETILEFKKRIQKVENQLGLKFTDEKLKSLPYIIIFVLERIERGHLIENFAIDYQELSDTKEYRATEEILFDQQNIPENERVFITLNLLASNIFSIDNPDRISIPHLREAVDQMLRNFEKQACIYLKDHDKLLNLLIQHIKPAYFRIKYQLTSDIDLFQGEASKQFSELQHLVKHSVAPLEHLMGRKMPDHEIAYITMIIGGWMLRKQQTLEHKLKAVVVCSQGVSVSGLLLFELRELFPELIFLDALSAREFETFHLDVDIVFSTIELKTDKKLFITTPLLNEEEKIRLRKQVMVEINGFLSQEINTEHILEIVSKYASIHDREALAYELDRYLFRGVDSPVRKRERRNTKITLQELIPPNRITLMESVSSWEQAVRICAKPLLREGYITPTFVDKMLSYAAQDPYIVIGSHVAIPHASPEDGVNKIGMSLLRVRNGVDYFEHSIHIIVVIAAIDKQQHLSALMKLLNLAQSQEHCQAIIQSHSKRDILNIIHQYSQ
ncbi:MULTISPECIES: BglG family transcription antiterminator [Geobacillus]|jgi:transcriptional antiterminator/mannitol/fructose-specific phosphotransferase system IIA component (Ntr-type)|uniref:BglG family transcription antiterminator n=1 Tax=Geobacillus TaxID=129337 RepID=UPI00041707D8|nr:MULTISPECIES: BglG family transcription antiterminator [Geobacillus]ARA98346.1 transcription antiterminator BglG [Geobacillus thermodenitrificans]KQB91699.1 transcription antiterminator BglG [Geobacillus sp. PA-3]